MYGQIYPAGGAVAVNMHSPKVVHWCPQSTHESTSITGSSVT